MNTLHSEFSRILSQDPMLCYALTHRLLPMKAASDEVIGVFVNDVLLKDKQLLTKVIIRCVKLRQSKGLELLQILNTK